MISFKKDIELYIVNRLDKEIVGGNDEVFKAGERVDAEIVSEDGPYVQLEFGDGSQAFGVLRECFDVLPVL